MLRALRNVFAMQSVTPEAVSNIMSKVCHFSRFNCRFLGMWSSTSGNRASPVLRILLQLASHTE